MQCSQWTAGGKPHGTKHGESGVAAVLGPVPVPAYSQPSPAPSGAACGSQLCCTLGKDRYASGPPK